MRTAKNPIDSNFQTHISSLFLYEIWPYKLEAIVRLKLCIISAWRENFVLTVLDRKREKQYIPYTHWYKNIIVLFLQNHVVWAHWALYILLKPVFCSVVMVIHLL